MRHINLSKHSIRLAKNEVRPVHSAEYQAGPTAGQFAAAEIIRMLAKMVIKLTTTEWAVTVVIAPRRMVHYDSV